MHKTWEAPCDRRRQLDCQLPSHSCCSSLDLVASCSNQFFCILLFCFSLHRFTSISLVVSCALSVSRRLWLAGNVPHARHLALIILVAWSAWLFEAIYQRFAPGGVVYDACAGWGGRLLGAPLAQRTGIKIYQSKFAVLNNIQRTICDGYSPIDSIHMKYWRCHCF